MANENQIKEIEQDIIEAKKVLEEGRGEKIREYFLDLKKLYANRNVGLIFDSSGMKSEMGSWDLRSGLRENRPPDYSAYKKDLKIAIRKLELYCAKLRDSLPSNSGININNNHSISANATINQTITLTQTLESIHNIPSTYLIDEDKERLKDLLASINGYKDIDPDKAKGKISEVLKFLADKAIDVGIATLPWILEVMKGL